MVARDVLSARGGGLTFRPGRFEVGDQGLHLGFGGLTRGPAYVLGGPSRLFEDLERLFARVRNLPLALGLVLPASLLELCVQAAAKAGGLQSQGVRPLELGDGSGPDVRKFPLDLLPRQAFALDARGFYGRQAGFNIRRVAVRRHRVDFGLRPVDYRLRGVGLSRGRASCARFGSRGRSVWRIGRVLAVVSSPRFPERVDEHGITPRCSDVWVAHFGKS